MAKSTPMIEQYLRMKRQHKDAILLFRMGDFYETFFEDAKIVSELLGLTLTSRPHGKSEKVPLAGVPHHALEGYLAKLIKAGRKVAICEQVEDPKKAKGIVKRDVVQVVTPGTALSEGILERKTSNYLVGICYDSDVAGLAFVDFSTGAFSVTQVPREQAWEELDRIRPSEVITSESWAKVFGETLRTRFPEVLLTAQEDWLFAHDFAADLLKEHFRVASLKGFGCEDLTAGVCAAGAVLNYLKDTQKAELSHINKLSRHDASEFVILDPATQRNLELTSSIQTGRKEGTLFSVIDRTRTAMGARMLRDWMANPLKDIPAINRRLDGVEELVGDPSILNQLTDLLRSVGDLERLISKICCGRANGRDLNALKDSLALAPEIRAALEAAASEILIQQREQMLDVGDLCQQIERAIVEDPPLSVKEGGIIRAGYDEQIDQIRKISKGGKEWIARLQAIERERTGIASLKVGYNRAFGYYIEVTKSNLSKVPYEYVRKQTLVNGERFITPELKDCEARVLNAEERLAELEYEAFLKVRSQVASKAETVQSVARAIACVDALASLADVAIAYDYARPEIDDGDTIEIEDGRHPVVERLLVGGAFVPNDTLVDNAHDQILVVTGPNMAGKSTYIRQVGLIVLLAQMGSFVPAKSAHIGLVDRIFTRVGASDNLAAGESTFLVEMNEAANILNCATPKSLVLLDEIGRGTSTFDGLSIAWAITEFLHQTQPKTLFATHYHELTELELILPRVKNYNVSVRETEDEVIFLRKIVEGGCDHSYGIEVARMAGLPQEVIARAKEVLANLEDNELTPNKVPKKARKRAQSHKDTPQISLFDKFPHPVVDEIQGFDVASSTPLEALKRIDEWKRKLKDDPTW